MYRTTTICIAAALVAGIAEFYEHAAEEAFSAEGNAENSEPREGRRDLREENSGERGRNESPRD